VRDHGRVLGPDRGVLDRRPVESTQFRSNAFVRELTHAGLVGSMGRVAAAGDNAAMESFFSLLQKNVLNRRRWDTRDDLGLAIMTWIERTYHRRRRQERLGRLTPIEFETLHTPALAPQDSQPRESTKPGADPIGSGTGMTLEDASRLISERVGAPAELVLINTTTASDPNPSQVADASSPDFLECATSFQDGIDALVSRLIARGR
jgi:putative transposase